MGYFNLSQSPLSKNLVLYPNGNEVSGASAYGAASNYECVDEDFLVPDDSDYTFVVGSSVVTDLYTLQNHTIETGTINYVKVIARVKSDCFSQSPSGVYRIKATYSTVTDKSEDFDIISEYGTYSFLLNSTPSDAAWTWNVVDNLRIGYEASSPDVDGSFSLISRPTSNFGGHIELNYFPPGTGSNWDKVDDVFLDNDSTYVYSRTGGNVHDEYWVEKPVDPGGTTITSVGVWGYWRNADGSSNDCKPNVYIREDSYGGDSFYTVGTGSPVYVLGGYNWSTRPGLGGPWTWVNVQNCKAGCGISSGGTGNNVRWSQVWLQINYTKPVSPEIRTSQMYAIVNYTPGSSTCSLTKPYVYTIEKTRDVGKFNSWSGNRYVYDIAKKTHTLSMQGICPAYEYDSIGFPEFPLTFPLTFGEYSSVSEQLQCVKLMKDSGVFVDFTGFDDDNLNTSWIITEFTYNISGDNPRLYEWSLTADKYESVS